MERNKVLVIACGGRKADTSAGSVRALDLYAGRQFAIARALRDAGWSIVILSAKHGVTTADQPLLAYDVKMTSAMAVRAVERIRDGSIGAHLFRAAVQGAERVVFFGGASYFRVWEALVAASGIARADSECEVEEIVGRGCGDHFSILKQILGEDAAASRKAA
jgi:hypothetical protein